MNNENFNSTAKLKQALVSSNEVLRVAVCEHPAKDRIILMRSGKQICTICGKEL